MALTKTAEKKDPKEKKTMKHAGPILEVSVPKSGEKKISKKLTVAGVSINSSPPSTVASKVDTDEKELKENQGNGRTNLNESFIVCSHVAEQLDGETIKLIAKENGIDLEHTPEEQRRLRKEMKQKIRMWKKCPNRMDLRNVCRDANGRACPIAQAFLTPQPPDPALLAASRLPLGTIGVGRRQVVFPTGRSSPYTNDPHQLQLGRRADGTMCVTVQYAPDPPPLPEYVCTTVRDTQAANEAPGGRKSKKGGKSSKSKKGKGKKK